jgi:hypothetical protein
MATNQTHSSAERLTFCSTRAVKVLNYLRRMAPDTIPRSSLDALETLPSSVLSALHEVSDWATVTKDEQLRNWLRNNPIPAANAKVSSPLFNGTLVFAQVSFAVPNKPPSSVSAADTQVAIAYATLAVVPIQRYASQYGPNSVGVWPVAIPYTARLRGTSFTKAEFEGWVDDVAGFMRKQQVSNPCIVVLHNRGLPNSPTFTGEVNSFHSRTGNGAPYCYCLVFGQNLSVADNNHVFNNKPKEKVYAHILSHEIAEMVVDPLGDDSNPEVCDACTDACGANLFTLFDQNGVFMGATADTASASGYKFFVNPIVRSDVALDSNFCVAPGGDKNRACVYPPPLAWNGPATLTTVGHPVSVAGHFSTGDQRHLVVVGTSAGKIHEIFWRPAQIGIEGQDDLPVSFRAGTIASVGSMYNVDRQRHLVVVGTTAGKVHEIFWKPDTVGIEGHDDLPVQFPANSIVGVAGLYDNFQQRYLVVLGTTAGRVHEIYWKDDTVGIEGHDDLPVTFAAGSIVGVTAFFDSDLQRYIVVVGTKAGKLHEIYWKADTAGIEGHDDLPVDFGSGPIVAVSGFYDSKRQRYVVAVGMADGTLRQVYWKASTVGIETSSVVAHFTQHSIVGLAAFYSATDSVDHIVVALSDGRIQELWVNPDV